MSNVPVPGAVSRASQRASLTSLELLRLAKAGDRIAIDELFRRHLPLLERWAHRRLPRGVRRLLETGDLVQDVMLNAFRRLDVFEHRQQGALQAYLRQSLKNRIADEFRSFKRHPSLHPLDSQHEDAGPSPVESVLSAETTAQYRRALAKLSVEDRELIVGRIEMDFWYEQLALATGRRTSDAARVATRRALLRLAAHIDVQS